MRALRREPRRALRLLCWGVGGLVLGTAAGIAAVAAANAVAAGRSASADHDSARIIDVGHLPPLLRLPGQQVTLRFNVFCPAPGKDAFDGEPCDAGGDVFVRGGTAGAFEKIPLRRTDDVADGRYVADVPADLAASPNGFSYYAVLRNEATGASLTVPSGQVVPFQVTPPSFAPSSDAPLRFAPVRSAPLRSALSSFAFARSAPTRLAP